jgi:hypothetical protein
MGRLLPRLIDATGFGLFVAYVASLLGIMAGAAWASWCSETGRPPPGEGLWPVAVLMVAPLGGACGFLWSLHRSGRGARDRVGRGGRRMGEVLSRMVRATGSSLLFAYASYLFMGMAESIWDSLFRDLGRPRPGDGVWAIAALVVAPVGGVLGFLWSLHRSSREARHRPDHDPRLHRRAPHRPRSDGRATPG